MSFEHRSQELEAVSAGYPGMAARAILGSSKRGIMISTKQMAVVSVLALSSMVAAQERDAEQRIGELIERLRREKSEGLADLLEAVERIEDAEFKLPWIRLSTEEEEQLEALLSRARVILVESEARGALEPDRRQAIYELLKSVKTEQGAQGGAAVAIRRRLRQTRLPLRFASVHVEDWAAFLSTVVEVPFQVSEDVHRMDPENTELRNFTLPAMPLDRSLRIIQEQTGVAHRVTHGSVILVANTEATMEDASPEQRRAVASEVRGVVHEVITILGMIGPSATDAIPTLERLTRNEDRQIAERARASLRQIKGDGR